MHRRPLGRGRRLAAIAALIILVGCVLPWWQFGGGDGLPAPDRQRVRGRRDPRVLRRRSRRSPSSRCRTRRTGRSRSTAALSYLVVVVIGWIGLVLRAIDLFSIGALGLPNTAPGLWLTALGLIVLSRAVVRDRRRAARPLTGSRGQPPGSGLSQTVGT